MSADDLDSDLYEEPKFHETLWLLWVRRGSILAVMAVVVGATLLYSSGQTDEVYRSSTEVLVRAIDRRLGPFQLHEFSDLEPERRVAESFEVDKLVAERLGGLQATARLVVEAPRDSNTLIFTATAPTGLAAQKMAEVSAQAYLDFRLQQILDDSRLTGEGMDRRIEELDAQISEVQTSLSAAGAAGGPRDDLQHRLDSLRAQRQFLEGARTELFLPLGLRVGRVLQPALVPATPVPSGRLKTIALGVLAGVALGVGQALVRSRLAPRLQGWRDLATAMDAPVLARVPGHRPGGPNGLVTLTKPDSKSAEAYETLRAALLPLLQQGKVRSLLITSPDVVEGKSKTVANLGVSLAQAGKRVVLVSADLRRPVLQSYFPGPHERGLTDLLGAGGRNVDALTTTFVEGLSVLHGGPVDDESPSLLASDAMRRVLDELEREADLVIIDAPPVLGTADTLAIAPLTDAVVVVASADRTTCAALIEARIRLEQVGAPVIGAVLNDVDDVRARFEQHFDRPNERDLPSGTQAPYREDGWSV